MTTFGFSAFLKIISLNVRPQRTALKDRLTKVGGYDFHRSFRLRSRQYLIDGEPLADVMAATTEIKKPAERISVQNALRQIEKWRSTYPGPIFSFDPVVYESPTGLFKVRFDPDIGMHLGEKRTAIHLWNTQKPALEARIVYAALSLFPELYTSRSAPDDLAVLSARDRRLYRLSDADDHSELGEIIVAHIEKVMEEIAGGKLPPLSPEPSPPPRLE